MDLTLNPHPKDKSIASLNSPLYIRGTFGAPKFSPDWKRLGAKGASAILMGVLSPILAVLPLMKEGKDKDSPCAQLIAEATKPAKQSAAEAKAGAQRPPAVEDKSKERREARESQPAAAGSSRPQQPVIPPSPPQ
jgi:hypothetical protein